MLAADSGGGTWHLLEATTGKELRHFARLPGSAACVAFSSDGKTVAAGGYHHDWICIADILTGKKRYFSRGERQSAIQTLAFSAGGKFLASGGEDHRVRLWDTATGNEIHRLAGHETDRFHGLGCLSVSLTPDGKTLASLGSDGKIRLWEPATGKPLRRLGLKEGRLSCMAFAPDGQILAAAGEDGWSRCAILFWEVATGKWLRCGAQQSSPTTFLAFSPDGELLTSCESYDHSIHVWEVATGKERHRLSGHDGAIPTATFSPDGKTLVTGSDDNSVRVWDVVAGKELRRLSGHGGYSISAVSFSPDGRILASVGDDGFISLWETNSYRRVRRFAKPVQWRSLVVFSPDGKLLAADSSDNTLSLSDATTGEIRYLIGGHEDSVLAVAFGPEGKTVVSGSSDGTALVWDSARVRAFGGGSKPTAPPPRTDGHGDPLPPGAVARLGSVRFRHQSGIASAAFSPDAKTVAVGTAGANDAELFIWDVGTGKQLLHIVDQTGPWTKNVAFSRDGKVLAASADAAMLFFDPATGARLHQFVGHPQYVSSFAFSSDGKILATAGGRDLESEDFAVRLWDVSTGEELRQLVGHRTPVEVVAFSANGNKLASSSSDTDIGDEEHRRTIKGRICVWDMVTGKLHRQLPSKGRSLAFSPDGNILAFQEDENTICLWDMSSDQALYRLAAPKAKLAFSPDGKMLATGGDGQPIRLWQVATGRNLRRFRGPQAKGAVPVCFSPNGKILASRSAGGWWGHDHSLRLWDVAMGNELRPFEGHSDSVSCLAFAPNGKTLVSGSLDRTVWTWKPQTADELRLFDRQPGDITAVALSADGKLAAAGDSDNTVTVWRTDTGKQSQRWEKPDRDRQGNPVHVRSVAFARDGKLLVAGSGDGTIRLWDIATKKELRQWTAHRGHISAVSLSPNGKVLASAGSDSDGFADAMIRFWSLASGRELLTIKLGTREDGPRSIEVPDVICWTIAFSADGTLLASAESRQEHFHGQYEDHKVRVWEVATGKAVLEMTAEPMVQSIAFAADSKLLATGTGSHWFMNSDRSVHLWDLATGQEIGQLSGHLGGVNALTFSPDGKTLATGSQDSTILIWEITRPVGRTGSAGRPASAKKLDELWADLAGADAARAYRSLWAMAAISGETVLFVEKRLHAARRPDAARLSRLVADVDNDQFTAREKATAELAKLGELAEPALRQALQGRPSLEARRRLAQLLNRLEQPPSSEQLRMLRSIALLERIGTPAARQALQELAHGAPEARLTQEATAALERLSRLPPAAR